MLFQDNKKTTPASTPNPQVRRKVENQTQTSPHSDTDDFGAYAQPQRKAPPRQPQAPRKQQQRRPRQQFSFGGFNRQSIIVALIAVVALIALVSLIIVFVSASSKDVKLGNNVYMSNCDDAGIWRVLYNGKTIGEYDNEIELITAEDRSFAYIIENGSEGYLVHVAKGRKIQTITGTPVTKVLATASLAPAVVWLEVDNGVYLYTEKHGEERITKDYTTLREDPNASGQYNYIFKISADGSTVAYAQTDTNTGEFHLYTYRDSLPQKSTKYLLPVAISDNGKFVFGYGISSKDGVTKAFYVVSGDDKYLIDEGFESVISLSAAGNEIVYTTNTETGIATYIYSFNPRKLDDDKEPHKIGNGVCVPVCADPEIVRPSTFKKTYFERIDGDDEISSPTYFVNRKYESASICSYRGKFSPDGDYFYYLNKSGALQRIKLSDKNHTPEKIAEDVVDFAITQKGNIYWLGDSGRLSFYHSSKGKTTRIADDAGSLVMHDYSNTLYYTSTESVGVYTTKEGSGKEEAKFGTIALTTLPTFTDPTQKKSYAVIWDVDNNKWNVFYTSNGKSFKQIATCLDIPGIDINDIFDDIISGTDINNNDQGIG